MDMKFTITSGPGAYAQTNGYDGTFKYPLLPLLENKRIYLDVPYTAREFAKYSHCGFRPREETLVYRLQEYQSGCFS